jgi:hypothetical protein
VKRAPVLVVALVALLACAVPFVRAQGDASLARITSIPMPEGFEVEEALSCDVDGDDVADLVIGSTGGDRRRLEIHVRHATGPAFLPAPDATLELTPDVVAYAAADVHADAGREILLLSASVVVAWRWRATSESERYHKLVDADFLWQWPDRRDLFHWEAGIKDLDGDGLEDLAIPGPWMYTIAFQRKAADGARTFTTRFELSPGDEDESKPRLEADRTPDVRQPGGKRRSSISFRGGGFEITSDRIAPPPWISISETVPAGQMCDWDGDGDFDLAFMTVKHVNVHVQEPRGTFSGKPVQLTNPVVIDRQRRLDVSYSMRTLDLDLDKRVDCVISAGDKRSDEVRTQVLVFLQKAIKPGDEPLFGKAGVPMQVLVLDGFAVPLAIEDVDGDGFPDLVAGAVRPNLIDGIRAAASERIDAELYVYRNTKAGFSKRPDLTQTLAIQAQGLDFTARFVGDVTGDGVSEFVERADEDKLRMHMIKKTRDGLSFIEKPIFEMPLAESSRVLLPGRLGPRTWDIFVLEKGAVRCASFR